MLQLLLSLYLFVQHSKSNVFEEGHHMNLIVDAHFLRDNVDQELFLVGFYTLISWFDFVDTPTLNIVHALQETHGLLYRLSHLLDALLFVDDIACLLDMNVI